MKYFTPALLERLASPDDDVADAAQHEWERAQVRSRRHWKRINEAVPKSVRRFEEARICLHDAQVLSLARNGKTLVVILQRDAPGRDVVILTFTLAESPIIDAEAVPGHGDCSAITWLYEEWDVDKRGRCWFEMLLSNGWSVRFCFSDFQFLVLPQILPAQNGRADIGEMAVPFSA